MCFCIIWKKRRGDFHQKSETKSNVIKCERERNKSDLRETKQIRQIHKNEHFALCIHSTSTSKNQQRNRGKKPMKITATGDKSKIKCLYVEYIEKKRSH